jgi:spore coat polysaccharide biosynthesis protein SpsF
MAIRAVLIVQMRLDSTRLPRKALLPLGDDILAGAVMRRLRRIPADAYVLASDADGATELGSVAAARGFEVYAGPKDDVLARFAGAARAHDADIIIRATGDNPFTSFELGAMLAERFVAGRADYSGYLGMPTGMGVELVRASALYRAEREAVLSAEREHVCPYLYNHPELFSIDRPACPPAWRLPEGRLTVDTAEDYERARRIVVELGSDPADAELLDWLRGRSGGGHERRLG